MSEKIITVAGRQKEMAIDRDGNSFRSGDETIELLSVAQNEAQIRVSGKTYVVPFVVDGTRVSFVFDGETYAADVTDKGARTKSRSRDHSMAAPMPGVVLKILVAKGDPVVKGAPLIVLEAMKMEHQILATNDGTVAAINCREGEMVQPGTDLVELN